MANSTNANDSLDHLSTSGHLVHFYDDPASLIPTAAQFLQGGLSAGRVVILVATEKHHVLVEDQLRNVGIDLETATREKRYLCYDAHESLAEFMVNDWPDEQKFMNFFSAIIELTGVQNQSSPIRVFGEMVTVLWNEGKRDAAIAVEELWNKLIARYSFSLLCAYPISDGEVGGDHYLKICGVHTGWHSHLTK